MGTARVVIGFLSRMRSDGGRRNGFVFRAFSLSRPGVTHKFHTPLLDSTACIVKYAICRVRLGLRDTL